MEKRVLFGNLEVREKGDTSKEMIVSGYATSFDTEYELGHTDNYRVLEVMAKNAFDETDMSDTIFQYNHEGRVLARVSNNTLTLSVDEHGLKVTADLSGTQEGRSLYEDIKGGYVTKMSIGFTVKSHEEKMVEDKDAEYRYTYVDTITGVERLFDVSAVSIPANEDTEISARSKERIENEIAEIEKREKADADAKEKADADAQEKVKSERERLALAIELSMK